MDKRKSILLLICLFVVLSIVQTGPIHAANREDWKTVRVSCGINNSIYLNDQGEPEGYCCEYLLKLAQINHWNLEYVEGSWNESVKNLTEGKIDLLFPTQMTEERKQTMGFSTSIGGYQPIGIFAKGDSKYCYDDFSEFDGARIAVSEGTSNEISMDEYASENKFTYEKVYLNTAKEKVDALNNGDVDLMVFSTLNDVPNGKVVAMIDYLPFYYCTNINDKKMLDDLNYGMNQMLIRQPELVENVFYSFINGNITLAYTRQEQEAIKNKGTITVGVYKDTAPLFDVDKNGNPSGIYVDLLDRIEQISGLNVEIRPLDRKEDAFDYLHSGKLDFVMGSSDQTLNVNKQNPAKYVQSEGVMDYYSIGITKINCTLTAESHFIVALTNGRKVWAPGIQKRCPNVQFMYFESSKDCLNAVESGKADVTIINSWEYNYQSKNKRFENLIEWETSRTLSETVLISLDDQDEVIRSIVDKAIEQISNPEKEGIITSNLNIPYDSYTIVDYLFEMRESLMIFIGVLLITIVGFSVFIVMRRRSMRALEAKNNLLEVANATKDQFLSRMSHELRTPLNAINGYATVLEQNLDTNEFDQTKIRDYIESILRATSYQKSIICDLLDIQKIESGSMVLQPVKIDAADYMSNIVDMIKQEADEKKIDFSYERLSVDTNTYILDGVRLQQILLNLLHNAVKFTPEGGMVKMTSEVIDQDEDTNTIKIVISDNGIGMSEDFQKHYLFKKFAQEYKGNTSPYEGCGTGLAISKEIIHLMGGEITCKSKKGIGTTFTVILVAKHEGMKKLKKDTSDINQFDLSGTRVLIVEDNVMNQEIEKTLLESMNCEVELAGDGQIGVEMFKNSEENYYDIVLMDIRMPNLDGWQATEKIRKLKRSDSKKIPIVAVSANAYAEDINKSFDVGMNDHLPKPVDVKTLYTKIKKYSNKLTSY